MASTLSIRTDRLHSLRRHREQTRRWSLGFIWVGSLLACFASLMVLDYVLVLSSTARGVSLSLVTAFLVVELAWLVWRFGRSASVKDIALELEQRRPDLGCVISTAAEYLPGGRAPQENYEPDLVAALQAQAARKLVVMEAPWWRRQLRLSALVAGAEGLLVVLGLTLIPGGTISARRVLWPWSQARVHRDRSQAGECRGGGVHGTADRSHYHRQAAPRSAIGMAENSWGPVGIRHHEERGIRSICRHPTIGRGSDLLSGRGRQHAFAIIPIDLVRSSRTQRREDSGHPAGYTRQSPHEAHSADLMVLRASRLDYEFRTAGVITNAKLRLANQPPLPLTRSGEHSWTNSLVALKDTYYWASLIDHKGRQGGNDKAFKLTVVPDENPAVDIIDPGLDIRSEPTNKVPVTISATDDYGVRELRLVFRKMNGAWHTNTVALPGGEAKEVEATTQLDLAPLDLREYELAAYYAEAIDNNTMDGPGIGRSPVYFVEYTTKEKPLGQCRSGNATQVNLIEFEKQIMAATTALADNAEVSRYQDVAGIQRQTKAYGLIFQTSPLLALAPDQARHEFESALKAMDQASASLENRERSAALANEEKALQHLYETCRLLPELEAGMCRGQQPCIKVVLEAIEKLKEQQKQERREALAQIIQQARRLVQQQERLGEAYSRLQQGQSRLDPFATSNVAPAQASGPANGTGSRFQAQVGNAGSLESTNMQGDGNRGQTNWMASQLRGSRPAVSHEQGKGKPESDNIGGAQPEKQPDEMASSGLSEEQRKQAEAAAALSRRLMELSGKDSRVSYRYGEMTQRASELWMEGSKSVRQGVTHAGSLQVAAGIALLRHVVESLEVIYGETGPVGDVAVEEYPKEFEAQISDYLKRLSYAH